jgi:hypothetical protein
MIEEATVDAYDESEQATGWFAMFEEHLEQAGLRPLWLETFLTVTASPPGRGASPARRGACVFRLRPRRRASATRRPPPCWRNSSTCRSKTRVAMGTYCLQT